MTNNIRTLKQKEMKERKEEERRKTVQIKLDNDQKLDIYIYRENIVFRINDMCVLYEVPGILTYFG